jgi:hypothetical protein
VSLRCHPAGQSQLGQHLSWLEESCRPHDQLPRSHSRGLWGIGNVVEVLPGANGVLQLWATMLPWALFCCAAWALLFGTTLLLAAVAATSAATWFASCRQR